MESVDKALVLARHVLEGEQRIVILTAGEREDRDVHVARARREIAEAKAMLSAVLDAMSKDERAVYNESLARVRAMTFGRK